nr:MAG TPA_asm: hypothetical protein [Caudoviricetes sp.]
MCSVFVFVLRYHGKGVFPCPLFPYSGRRNDGVF